MAIFASLSKNGFWDDSLGEPPEDGYVVSDEQHQEYLAARTSGKIIDFSYCPPSLTEPSVSIEQLAEIERRWRNSQLVVTDGVISRHRDELEEKVATTFTTEQYSGVQTYRRQLRDWPKSMGFPDASQRPFAPSWFVGQDR